MITSILDPECNSCNGLEVIVAMNPSESCDTLVDSLLDTNCKVYLTKSPVDAFAKLQFHAFAIVVLEENYSMEMIGLLASLPMVVRREIFYVLVGDSLETGNMMQSYILSANLVVNRTDISQFAQILNNFFLDNNRFYRPFYYVSQNVYSGKS